MIRIATLDDVSFIESIAYHEDVKKYIWDGVSEVDFNEIVQNNIVYISEFGAIIFERISRAVYQFHTMFLPEGRGKHAYKVARATSHAMFTKTNAMELVTYSPHDTPHSTPPKTFGFKPWFTRENVIRGTGATWYRLHVNDWIMKDKTFSKNWVGDKSQFIMIASLSSMIENGMPEKGYMLYNTWAVCAGFPPIIAELKEI